MLEDKLEIDLKDKDFGSKYAGKYVFIPLSWGSSNRISGECTKIDAATKRSSVDIKTLQARMVMATLIDKPKIITLEHLLDESSNGLPVALGELLMAAADKVNGYSTEDRETLKNLKVRWGLE